MIRSSLIVRYTVQGKSPRAYATVPGPTPSRSRWRCRPLPASVPYGTPCDGRSHLILFRDGRSHSVQSCDGRSHSILSCDGRSHLILPCDGRSHLILPCDGRSHLILFCDGRSHSIHVLRQSTSPSEVERSLWLVSCRLWLSIDRYSVLP